MTNTIKHITNQFIRTFLKRNCKFLILSIYITPSLIHSQTNLPNVIIIVADDLGYGDLGSYNNKIIKTKSLDKLASEGIKMTNCYSTSPMCSPARAGILTGRSPYRTGVYDWIAPDSTMYLPKKEITIAKLLKKKGYQTSSIGKWHLNGKFNTTTQPQPNDHGFDYWFGCQYSLKHFNPEGFYTNGIPNSTKGFACDIVADEAINWLEDIRKPNIPFFQYICFLEPHEPIMSPSKLTASYIKHGKKAEYYANVQNLDQAIGRLIQKLDALKLSENTLVIFTSDNGPAQYTPNGYFNKSHGSAGPLKGYKRHMFEGGIRVPGIFRWLGKISPNQIIDTPISNTDFLPTICKLARISLPTDRTIDGTDISPIFENKKIKRKTPLHWHFYDPWGGPQSLLRKGDWIIAASWDVGDFHKRGRFDPNEIKIIKGSKLKEFKLYNIVKDKHQDVDIAAEHPKLFNKLKKQLKKSHKSVMLEAPYITNNPNY